MKIRWLGHASFLITSKEGVKILTDPYDDSIGYQMGKVEADVVTVSHSHYDHNYLQRAEGSPQVINRPGVSEAKGITFKGISSFHDKTSGRERGTNLIFTFTLDGVKICHLGDLGHILTAEQVSSLSAVDLLFIPVGGVFTIDFKEANQVCEQLKAKVIFPMHYKTKVLNLSIDAVDRFLQGKSKVQRLNLSQVEVSKESLPAEGSEIIVLNYV